MNVLILSVAAGGGHIHAAEAIKRYILLNDSKSNVQVVDTLKYINPLIDKVVIGSYLQTIKITPSLFGKLYTLSENEDGLATVSNKVNELFALKLLPLLKDLKPDLLVCTHPFPAEMVSTLKSKHKVDIPMVCTLTDFAPHNLWIQPGTDAYVVSNSDMIEEMIARGVPRDSIYDLGIPVTPEFLTKYDRTETLKELNLNLNKTTILIMGGSLGIGKIENLYEELIKVSHDIQIIIITGNNKKLYSILSKLQESSPKETRILGYTKEVNKYMQCCDLLLTKPGGLTITEALVCKIPMAIFSPIPGQEEKNAEFLVKHNLAINMGDGRECKRMIQDLLSNPRKIMEMKSCCSLFSKPQSGNEIYKLLNTLLKKQLIIQ